MQAGDLSGGDMADLSACFRCFRQSCLAGVCALYAWGYGKAETLETWKRPDA